MRFTSISQELSVTGFKKGIEREIEAYFEGMGFSLIEPRIFQKYDDYLRSNLHQDASRTVKVLGGDSRILILRPDITTNVLAEIFSKWDGEPPLRVYYNSKIYHTRPGGKIQEQYQMGVESLGDDMLQADLEIVGMATTLMAGLGVPHLLELGSSKYLDGWFREQALPEAVERELRDLVRTKNRSALNANLDRLELSGSILGSILDLQGDMESVLGSARRRPMNEEMRIALDELEALRSFLAQRELAGRVKFDLSLVPDLDYYDGIIFKGFCLGTPQKVLSGGRYDRLTEEFGPRVPAIGFMIDMDLVTRIRLRRED